MMLDELLETCTTQSHEEARFTQHSNIMQHSVALMGGLVMLQEGCLRTS